MNGEQQFYALLIGASLLLAAALGCAFWWLGEHRAQTETEIIISLPIRIVEH